MLIVIPGELRARAKRGKGTQDETRRDGLESAVSPASQHVKKMLLHILGPLPSRKLTLALAGDDNVAFSHPFGESRHDGAALVLAETSPFGDFAQRAAAAGA